MHTKNTPLTKFGRNQSVLDLNSPILFYRQSREPQKGEGAPNSESDFGIVFYAPKNPTHQIWAKFQSVLHSNSPILFYRQKRGPQKEEGAPKVKFDFKIVFYAPKNPIHRKWMMHHKNLIFGALNCDSSHCGVAGRGMYSQILKLLLRSRSGNFSKSSGHFFECDVIRGVEGGGCTHKS